MREALLWTGAALGVIAVLSGLAIVAFGLSLLVFRSGSMAPAIDTGALAVSRTVPAAEIERGDVVSVEASTGDRITHRVEQNTVRDGLGTLVLKGDANATADDEVYPVRSAERVLFSLPWAGYAIVYALTPAGIITLACLCGMLLVLGSASDDRGGSRRHARRRRTSDDDSGDVGGGPGRRGRLAASASVLALLVVVAVAGATSGTWAFLTDNPTASTGAFSVNRYYTCDAAARGIASSPSLYWRFNEATIVPGSTTAADSSTAGRPGTYQGNLVTVTTLTAGVTAGAARACGSRDGGTAITLDGSSGYVAGQSATANPAPDTFTAAIWFKTGTTRGGKLIGFGNTRVGTASNYDRHVYMTNAGKIVFGSYPGTVRTVTSPLSYNDDRWHQAVATQSAAGMRLYVDGVLVASRTDTTTGQAYSGWWRVGFDNLNGWTDVPTSSYFAGTLDEAAVYSGAASDAEIAAGYRAFAG